MGARAQKEQSPLASLFYGYDTRKSVLQTHLEYAGVMNSSSLVSRKRRF